MNRTILIVICDFLLVSLLAFSTVDINKVADEGVERQAKVEIVTKPDNRQDLGVVMRQALEEERKNREQLIGELSRTRETLTKNQQLLTQREQQVQSIQKELQTREQQSAALQQQQNQLQQQYAAAQTNLQSLNQRLQNTAKEALLSKEKIALMEAENRKQVAAAATLKQQLEQQLAQLAQSNQLALAEKQKLAGQLQLAEAEKRFASQQAAQMAEQIKHERDEKAKLAEGVKALATKSGQLAQEIRENRPLSPNTIFNEFVSNRVQTVLTASRATLLGIDSNRQKETDTVLVTDGKKTFALCHVQETPLIFWDPGVDWEQLAGTLSHKRASFPVSCLLFHRVDPRVVLMPLTESQARDLGCKVYRVSNEPFKFQDAVLVGAREGYYGECKFQIDLSTPEYVKMDHSSIKGLFGKFNPSRGDLVFSKTGELLGVMANSTYCMMLNSFDAAVSFQFGDTRAQRTGQTLSRFYSQVLKMPYKLQ